MVKTLVSMLLMLLSSLHVHAADSTFNFATIDGRLFEALTAVDVETLGAADKAAYQVWQARRDTETSTYQQSEGPNTMDISSDFSM
ncbi:MAG: hypothetical protein ACAH05_07090 [Methylophilus sp.]|nr:hypothetical protein [Methylophilus sp.]